MNTVQTKRNVGQLCDDIIEAGISSTKDFFKFLGNSILFTTGATLGTAQALYSPFTLPTSIKQLDDVFEGREPYDKIPQAAVGGYVPFRATIGGTLAIVYPFLAISADKGKEYLAAVLVSNAASYIYKKHLDKKKEEEHRKYLSRKTV